MKVKVSINGIKEIIAEVSGKGHLGTHVNLDDKKGTGSPKMDVSTSGYDTNNEKVTKYLKWQKKELLAGDEVCISILPKDLDESDSPEQFTLSSDNKRTMIEDPEIADQILGIAYNYNRELTGLLHELKNNLSKDDQMKLRRAIGHIINEIFARLIEPIYRKHPDKVPEEMKDMPL